MPAPSIHHRTPGSAPPWKKRVPRSNAGCFVDSLNEQSRREKETRWPNPSAVRVSDKNSPGWASMLPNALLIGALCSSQHRLVCEPNNPVYELFKNTDIQSAGSWGLWMELASDNEPIVRCISIPSIMPSWHRAVTLKASARRSIAMW